MITINNDGEILNHIPGINSYATICGLDGDDVAPDYGVNQTTIATPRGARINCPACVQIWIEMTSFPRRLIDTETLASVRSRKGGAQ